MASAPGRWRGPREPHYSRKPPPSVPYRYHHEEEFRSQEAHQSQQLWDSRDHTEYHNHSLPHSHTFPANPYSSDQVYGSRSQPLLSPAPLFREPISDDILGHPRPLFDHYKEGRLQRYLPRPDDPYYHRHHRDEEPFSRSHSSVDDPRHHPPNSRPFPPREYGHFCQPSYSDVFMPSRRKGLNEPKPLLDLIPQPPFDRRFPPPHHRPFPGPDVNEHSEPVALRERRRLDDHSRMVDMWQAKDDRPHSLLDDDIGARRPRYDQKPLVRRDEDREFSSRAGLDRAPAPRVGSAPIPKWPHTQHFSDSELDRNWKRSGSSPRRGSSERVLESSGDHPTPLDLPLSSRGSVFKRLDRSQPHSSPKALMAPDNISLDQSLRPSLVEHLGHAPLHGPEEGSPAIEPLYSGTSSAPAICLPDLRDELNARHGSSLGKPSPEDQRTTARFVKERHTPLSSNESRKQGELPTFGKSTSDSIRERKSSGTDTTLRRSVRGEMKRAADDSSRGGAVAHVKQNIQSSGNNASQPSLGGRRYMTRSQNSQLEKQDTEIKDDRHSMTRNEATVPERQSGGTTGESRSNVRYITRSQVSLRGKQDSDPGSNGQVSTRSRSAAQRMRHESGHSKFKARKSVDEEQDTSCKKCVSEPTDMPSSENSECLSGGSVEKRNSNHVSEHTSSTSNPISLPATNTLERQSVLVKNSPVANREGQKSYSFVPRHHDPLIEVDSALSGSLMSEGTALPFADFDTTGEVSACALKIVSSDCVTMESKLASPLVHHAGSSTSQQTSDTTSSQVDTGPVPSTAGLCEIERKSVPEELAQFGEFQVIDELKLGKEGTLARQSSPVSLSLEEQDKVKLQLKDRAQVIHESPSAKVQKASTAPTPPQLTTIRSNVVKPAPESCDLIPATVSGVSSCNTSQTIVSLPPKDVPSVGLPIVSRLTPLVGRPHQPAKHQQGKAHFLQLADKVCGEELVQRLEDYGLPIYSFNRSPLEFLYAATVDALKKFRQKKFRGSLDGEYYISQMVRGCVKPAESFRDLFEMEVGVLKEQCGQDLKLWCYHVINYRKMVRPPRKCGVGVILHVFKCIMPSLGLVPPVNSSLSQFGHNCQDMTRRVLGPDLMFDLLNTPLPGHHNQSPLPVFFISVKYALERKQKDYTTKKNLSWRGYFTKTMQEYQIGKLTSLQSLDVLREAEVRGLKELCGEDIKVWCYHVLRYTGLVGLHPSHGNLSPDTKNGYANLLVAEMVYSIIHDLPFHRANSEASQCPFKLLQQQLPCAVNEIRRKSKKARNANNSTYNQEALCAGFTKDREASLGQRLIEEAGMPQISQHRPGEGEASRSSSASSLATLSHVESSPPDTLEVISVWEASEDGELVDEHTNSNSDCENRSGSWKEASRPHILRNNHSTNADAPDGKLASGILSSSDWSPCLPAPMHLPHKVSFMSSSELPLSQNSLTSSARQPANSTTHSTQSCVSHTQHTSSHASHHNSQSTSTGPSPYQQKSSTGNLSARDTTAPPLLTALRQKIRAYSNSSDGAEVYSGSLHWPQSSSHMKDQDNQNCVSASGSKPDKELTFSTSVPPSLAPAKDDSHSAKERESPELGEINSPESGEIFSPDPHRNPRLEEISLEPGEIVSPILNLSPEPGEIVSPTTRNSPDLEDLCVRLKPKEVAGSRDRHSLAFGATYRHSELQERPNFWHTQERTPHSQHHSHKRSLPQQQPKRKVKWSPLRRWLAPRKSRSPQRRHGRMHRYSPPPERRARSRSPLSSRHSRLQDRESTSRGYRSERRSRLQRRSVGGCASDDETELLELRKEALLSMINRNNEREEDEKETSPITSSLPPLTPLSDMSECSILSDTILDGKCPNSIASTLLSSGANQQDCSFKDAAVELIASSLLGLHPSTDSIQDLDKTGVHMEVVEARPDGAEDVQGSLKMVPGKDQAKDKVSMDVMVPDPPVAPARAHTFPMAAGQRLSLLKQEGARSGRSSRSASPLPQNSRKTNSAVQVVTNKNSTWKVSEFKISAFSSESSSSDEEEEIADVDSPPDHSALNMMIHLFRKASETTDHAEVQSSPSTSLTSPLPHLTPSSVGMLPPKKQHEYKELKKKLREHQQRQNRKRKAPDDLETSTLVTEQQATFTAFAANKKRAKVEEDNKLAQKLAVQEKERKETLQQYYQEMSKCRAAVEGNKRVLSSLTHSLADCETTMEEYELKIRLLKEKLKSAESELRECEMKKSSLQSKLRQTKNELDSNTTFIRQLEKKIAVEQQPLGPSLLSSPPSYPECPPSNFTGPSLLQPPAAVFVKDANLSLPVLEIEAVSDSNSDKSLEDVQSTDLPPSVKFATIPTTTPPRDGSFVGTPIECQQSGQSSSTALPPPPIFVEPVTESEGEDDDKENNRKRETASALVPELKFVEPVTESEGEDDKENNKRIDFASVHVCEEKVVQDTAIFEPVPLAQVHSPGIESVSDAENEKHSPGIKSISDVENEKHSPGVESISNAENEKRSPGIESVSDVENGNEVMEQDPEPAQVHLPLGPPPVSMEDVSEDGSCYGQDNQLVSQVGSMFSPTPQGSTGLSEEASNIAPDSHLIHALTLLQLSKPTIKPLSHTLAAMLLIDQSERASFLYQSSDTFFPVAEEEVPMSGEAADERAAAEDDPAKVSIQLPTIVVSLEPAHSPTSASMMTTIPNSPVLTDSAPSSPGNVASPAATAGTSVAKRKKRKTKKTTTDSKLVEKALLLERVTKHQKEILEMRHGLMSALVHKKTGEGKGVPKGSLMATAPSSKSIGEMKKLPATLQVAGPAALATNKKKLKPKKKVVEEKSLRKTPSAPAKTSVSTSPPCSSSHPSDKPGKQTLEMLSLLQISSEEEDQFLNNLKAWTPHWNDKRRAPIPLTPLILVTRKGLMPGGQHKLSTQKIPSLLMQQVLDSEQDKAEKAPCTSTPEYSAYSSPLLMMGSYRLSPFYRTLFKLPLNSLTYSHKMDPNRFLCKYELQGRCNNTKCPAQHMRDVTPSIDEVVTDLSSYYHEAKSCNISDKDETVAGLVSQIQGFGGKLSDEELLALAAHTTHKHVSKALGAFSCVAVSNKRESAIAGKEEVEEAIPPLPETRRPIPILVDTETEPQSTVLMATKSGTSQRYFSSLSEGQFASPTTPTDPAYWLEQLRATRQSQREDTDAVLAKIEEAIQHDSVAEEVWIECLDIMACIFHEKTNEGKLEAFLERATTASPTYSVYWKVISIVTSVSEKQDWIAQAYLTLVSQLEQDGRTWTSDISHKLMELVLSLVSLYLTSGYPQQALAVLQGIVANERATPTPERTTPTPERTTPTPEMATPMLESSYKSFTTAATVFRSIARWLVQSDRLFLGLCHLHLLACSHLPSCIVGGSASSCSSPIRISSKEPFLILWKTYQVENRVMARIMTTFRVFMRLCTDKQLSNTSNILHCLPLYLNLFLFEASQGFGSSAQNSLERLLEEAPQCLELWLFASKLDASLGNLDLAREKLVKATQMCPREPLLYYSLALLELAAASDSFVEKAIGWLDKCLGIFYQFPCDEERTLDFVLLLYRRLLGQFVPYTFTPPPFMEGESMSAPQLGHHLVPVWLCYCLVVELTSPPGSGMNDEMNTYSCSLEAAFESALHSVHRDQEGLKGLWLAYLLYQQARACGPSASPDTVRQYLDCAKRSLLAMNSHTHFPNQIMGQPSEREEYTFHNHVADIVFESVHTTSHLVALALRLVRAQPSNLYLMTRLAEYVLKNEEVEQGGVSEESHSLQMLLISYCYKHPEYLPLWRRVIVLEIKHNHYREARWMFRQAVKSSPLDALLWSEYLIFELQRMIEGGGQSNLSLIRPLIEKCDKLGVDWRSLSTTLASQSH